MQNKALIFETGRRTLAIEADTLIELRDTLDDRFCEVVQAVYQATGRLVVTGIGKSALVAQKLTATFNSTGTPSLFMHAADAIHGDLGMIQAGDLVLCLSKSGETTELRALVPLLRRLGHPLIALVSRGDSYLARSADYVLHCPVRREADPNNLAPTASALAQMAMGDALATALLALRGFSPNDFAQYHPGGALGKQLYLTLGQLACHNALPAVSTDASLQEVIIEITGKRLGATAVTDADGGLLGIITDGDLRRMLERGQQTGHLRAGDIMTSSPHTLPETELAVHGLNLLQQHTINHLLLLDNRNRYVGMVHLHDFIREGLV